MPAAELQTPFASICAENGIELVPSPRIDRLTNRGHAELRTDDGEEASSLDRMRRIFASLDGDEAILFSKGARSLSPDFSLAESGHLVELDEEQHFTTARLATLDHYDGLDFAWDVEEYRSLCGKWRERGDKAFRHKQAKEFPGALGRQRQRAYFDSVRDIVAPIVSDSPGVLRIAVPERDLQLGLRRFQRQLERIAT